MQIRFGKDRKGQWRREYTGALCQQDRLDLVVKLLKLVIVLFGADERMGADHLGLLGAAVVWIAFPWVADITHHETGDCFHQSIRAVLVGKVELESRRLL